MTGKPAAVGAAVLVLAAFLFAPLAVLAPKGLAPLALIAALAALPGVAAGGWRLPRALRPVALVVAAMVAWFWLSALWSVDPGLSRSRALQLTLVAVVGLLLLAGLSELALRRRRRLALALCIGLAVGLAILAVDAALVGGLRRAIRDDPGYTGMAALNRGATVAALLLWPAVAWLWRHGGARRWPRPAALALVAALVAVLALLESQSAAAAFAVGLITFAAVLLARRLVIRALALAVAVAIMAAPVLPVTLLAPGVAYEWAHALSSTAVHRLYIWRFTADRIFEHRVLGWGLDSSRVIPGADIVITRFDPTLPRIPYDGMEALPLHPHNAPLQIWLELGLPGAALFALLCAGVLVAVARRVAEPLAAAAAAAAIMVAVALSSFSYGIWQTWWLGALWLAAALIAAMARAEE